MVWWQSLVVSGVSVQSTWTRASRVDGSVTIRHRSRAAEIRGLAERLLWGSGSYTVVVAGLFDVHPRIAR